jgi:putative DNA primase/helicase
MDNNPYLLNFTNGTVDLRTAELRPHRREDFITKLIHHVFDPNAQCSRFLAFLNRAMGGDVDPERAKRLVAYLQRALGYSLIAVTREKAVFVPFGKPDSGKTTLLSIILDLVSDYATTIQVTSLMAKRDSNNVSADLADLRGVRFVMTSEPSSDQKLATGTVKRITQGGAKVKATRKYENPIIFPETHTVWMDCNKLPGLSDPDDEAIVNRLHPIPFNVQTPKDEIDRELPAKLMAEAEGILAWLVDGARIWNEFGLLPPQEVHDARDAWRRADPLVRFLEECCVISAERDVQGRVAYSAFKAWWASANIDGLIPTETEFGIRMTKRFEKKHQETGAVYYGIGLQSVSK